MFKTQTSTANAPVSFVRSDGDAKEKLTQGNDVGEAPAKPAQTYRPADLRLHFGPYFLRIIAGKERRSSARLKQERKENPAFTLRNLPLIMVIWFLSGGALLYFLGRTLDIIAQM